MSGIYVYHRVPADLRGAVLYPLNELKGMYPDLYAERRKSYATREDIASLRLPQLGYCLWNDVLHFTAAHPQTLKAALESAGHVLPQGWNRFFQVDASLLDPASAVIYKNTLGPLWPGQFDVDAASAQIGSDSLPFDPVVLSGFAAIPEAALRYYAGEPAGSPLMLFLNVPHVLYRGSIDLNHDGVTIVEV